MKRIAVTLLFLICIFNFSLAVDLSPCRVDTDELHHQYSALYGEEHSYSRVDLQSDVQERAGLYFFKHRIAPRKNFHKATLINSGNSLTELTRTPKLEQNNFSIELCRATVFVIITQDLPPPSFI